MKAIDLRLRSFEELKRDLVDLLREYFNLRMQKVNEQLSRHTQLGRVRRDIARVKTVLNEKKVALHG
jgi:large subunit ribosomal protein L29